MKRFIYNIASLICFLITFHLPNLSLSQDPYGIAIESRWPFGPIFAVGQYGDMAYYGNGSVLMIYNISDINHPVKVKEMELESAPIEILAEDDQLFITQEQYGLYVYDISNPANPLLQGKHQNDGFYPIFTKQDNLGVYATSEKIDLINLNDPENIVRMSSIELENRARSLALHNKFLYVGMYDKLLIYDVSDPTIPALVHSSDYSYVYKILIINDEAYIGHSDTLRLLDITDDMNPVELSFTVEQYAFSDLVYNNGLLFSAGGGGRIYVWERNGNNFQLISNKPFEGYIEDLDHKGDVLLCASLHYGLEFIDVSDVYNMTLMYTLKANSQTVDVKTNQGYIYAAQSRSGLGIYQKDNSGNIIQQSKYPFENARALKIRDDVLFLAGYGDGFVIMDISNPIQPVELSRTYIGGNAYELDINDHYLYLANGKEGFSIFNISDLSNPVWLSSLPMEHIAVNVRYHDGYAYVSDYREGLKIVDVSDPASPRLKSTFKTDRDNSVYVGNVFDVEIKGKYAYVGDHSYGFQVVDISDKSNPVRIDNFWTGSRPYDIELNDDLLYIALSYNGVMAYDISDPIAPERYAYLNTGGELNKIDLYDGLIYGADGSAGILILNPWFSTSEKDIYSMPIDVKIYPNPASLHSIMEISGEWDHPLMIKIITMDGRIISSTSLNAHTLISTIPMQDLIYPENKQGIYFLVIATNNKIKSIPFMWSP